MDHRAALILAASLLCGSVHAGYAQLSPPPAWGAGGGLSSGAGGTFNFPAAANAANVAQSTVRTNAALNVAGRAVQVPVAMRLAANAPQIAARVAFGNPYIMAGAGALALAAWIASKNITYDPASGFQQADPNNEPQVSDGYFWNASTAPGYYPDRLTPYDVCMLDIGPGYGGFRGCTKIGENSYSVTYRMDLTSWTINAIAYKTGNQSACPSGWYVTPAGCVQKRPGHPITEQDFVRQLGGSPLPDNVPQYIPSPLPVEVPFFDPVFIPTGNPVKNPNYDPSAPVSPNNQPYAQPGVRVSPAPAANAPWQVNLEPVNRPVDSPTPNPEPSVDSPEAGKDDKPRDPEKDGRDFCDRYPDVLACQKLDEPEDPGKLKTQEVDFNFQPESGFAGSASCPAPMSFNVHGHVINISWQPFCNSLDMIKPFLLAMAWLSAAFIMLGGRRE